MYLPSGMDWKPNGPDLTRAMSCSVVIKRSVFIACTVDLQLVRTPLLAINTVLCQCTAFCLYINK